MATEPIFESVKINERRALPTERVSVQCRTDVLSEDVKKVLGISALPSTCVGEVDKNKIKYNGKVYFHVIYLDNEDNVNRVECGSEYLGTLDFDLDKDVEFTPIISAKAGRCEYDNSGARLSVSCLLTLQVELSQNYGVKTLVGGDNLVLNNSEQYYVKSYGVKKGVYPIEEEFELNYSLHKMLSNCQEVKITAVQAGVGCIIVDGELHLSVLLLQNDQKSSIIREERSFPFRMEVEYEEAMPSMTASLQVTKKAFKMDFTVDEEGAKTKALATVTLHFECEAFSKEGVSLALDAYCTANHTEVNKKACNCLLPVGVKTATANISGRANCEEMPSGTRLMAVGCEGVEITDYQKDGENTLSVTGVLSMRGYLCDSEGVLFSAVWETPFTQQLDCLVNPDESFKIEAICLNPSAKIISLNEVEIQAQVAFNVWVYENLNFCCVTDVKLGDEKRMNDRAISVYIAEEGENLWSLAKRLNVCPDQLVTTNPELQFPLTGKERILVYRQK